MAKRKVQEAVNGAKTPQAPPKKKSKPTASSKETKKETKPRPTATSETIQIVVGSYDRILHGLSATIGLSEKSKEKSKEVDFADTFLFGAHTAAIRCIAVSPVSAPIPGQTQKVLLASGSGDERINVYSLSAHPPSRKNQDLLAKVAPRPILENRKNRELGTLLHHSSTVTALRFPTRSKLLSSSEDSTIAVTRTRDWSTLSSIKAPRPKAIGRPSGDTAAFGATPSGVNDFAIHPSMKLMISVSKGERCMRLWNLVTGKKAGVLNFDRETLQEAGEGKHSSGEGRTVVWGRADGEDEFAVGFDRDVVVFGMDSVPKCRVMPTTRTKIHKFGYLELEEQEEGKDEEKTKEGLSLLAVATEDGRIAFFSTRKADLSPPSTPSGELAVAKAVGHLGGKESGVEGRIKDFVFVRSGVDAEKLYAVGVSSDGKVRVWSVDVTALKNKANAAAADVSSSKKEAESTAGRLLGTYETQNRITCLAAYMMIPRPEGAQDSEDELEEDQDNEEGEDSSEDDEE